MSDPPILNYQATRSQPPSTSMAIISIGCFLMTAFAILMLGEPLVVLITLLGLACGIVAIRKSPRSTAAWVATVLNGVAATFILLAVIY